MFSILLFFNLFKRKLAAYYQFALLVKAFRVKRVKHNHQFINTLHEVLGYIANYKQLVRRSAVERHVSILI